MKPFNIDHQREQRLGFPEIIFGASKPVDLIRQILLKYQERGENALVTKLQKKKARRLFKTFPDAFYDEHSGAFMLRFSEEKLQETSIAILAAGTSDLFVVNEVYYTLAFLGLKATCIMDIGVAGVHRFLNRLEELKSFSILIIAAGFEGALPTVAAGLLPQPIIAVPVSVGYGVAEGGKAALSSMLASCANGVSVVNIDNGYGAAMAALRIFHQMKK